jgi:hypothetical protein
MEAEGKAAILNWSMCRGGMKVLLPLVATMNHSCRSNTRLFQAGRPTQPFLGLGLGIAADILTYLHRTVSSKKTRKTVVFAVCYQMPTME